MNYINLNRPKPMAGSSPSGETGIYDGTGAGQAFDNRGAGDTWQLRSDYLPPVFSVETAPIA